ncbi:MAG: zinc-binding dehydrogenase [Deltaproteobacteria bacterium]|nr:zinc-binding dehydrogenase [Deltaproteobacteria bacterium]
MRAIWITRYGGPDVLEVREAPDPVPDPGKIRVRVKACGLNFAEMMARKGMYPDAPKPPCVVGYEAAGVVDLLGEGVTSVKVGDRVVVMVKFGAHADTVIAAPGQAFPMPPAMSFEEGAAIPVNYMTSHLMLFRAAALRPGGSVLIHMAAGGVGLSAIQLCRTVPDVTIFGTASATKHDFLRQAGCTHPIDYHTLDYAAEVMRLTDNRGVDIVLDPLGGKDWKKGLTLLKPFGMLVAFGFANLSRGDTRSWIHAVGQLLSVPLLSPLSLMVKNRSVAGVHVGHLWHEPELVAETLRALLSLYAAGKIKPHIDKVFQFSEAAAAHRRMQGRENVGKIILAPD